MVHWSGEMKHIIVVIIAVLSALHRDVLCSTKTGCPRRYLRRINGKCYYFSVKKLNWFGALNNCLRKGLTLADLSNPRDFYGAIEFLSSKGNTEDFWFGANDLQTEGRFQYISNGRLVRYFSNYSLVGQSAHGKCDDCLEVRIRNNMTVVADDNCLERQYFICSERYCDFAESTKKRHHSHEHLHHFHHDIGEPSDEAEAGVDVDGQQPDLQELLTDKPEGSEEGVDPPVGGPTSGPESNENPSNATTVTVDNNVATTVQKGPEKPTVDPNKSPEVGTEVSSEPPEGTKMTTDEPPTTVKPTEVASTDKTSGTTTVGPSDPNNEPNATK
ncbi:hypothetical protein AWZ03_009035 [Drosophila navojoa]|uniref:C-type lectin domain-containing protein n=1 Tax=Drosophila navojoa TaxID=7232 RepID=A0A484B705_DRONA|nr:uncharacterized protein LOC108652893 [Drosophila navojoa]TDG44563.1 hypothetical protein AWZ03_009035 [Drosophila navojoa]